ncbi:hypothetical protein D9757_001799 [Collybiopsis confluens]|uniref:Phospholipid scramblase n=1 Tax=Collybiopsis confluens TaxID=2823264 RepID=A0A8H5HYB7_9AGAR|nr:hypothetical protein D9757_001799 [Collybiopsis confluens]
MPNRQAALDEQTEPHLDLSVNDSPLWNAAESLDPTGSESALERLLLANDTLVVERHTNKYSISNSAGEQVGFIAEEPGGFLSSFNRQILSTHRPFKALVMDPSGTPILFVRRPFAWINSRMYVQRPNPGQEVIQTSSSSEAVLDTFAEVQQIWHPFRRRYDLFLRESPKRILSLASDLQPEPELDSDTFNQMGKVDAPFLAWNFTVEDAAAQEIAFISRNFRGFDIYRHWRVPSRFLDHFSGLIDFLGQYLLHFGPRPQVDTTGNLLYPTESSRLILEQRALILALAVNIDFDYFSRHSGGPGFFHFGAWD